jgi:hypothetical protein
LEQIVYGHVGGMVVAFAAIVALQNRARVAIRQAQGSESLVLCLTSPTLSQDINSLVFFMHPILMP